MTDKPKSVVLDYDHYHNVIVPMEAENDRLKHLLDEERGNKKIKIVFDLSHQTGRRGFYYDPTGKDRKEIELLVIDEGFESDTVKDEEVKIIVNGLLFSLQKTLREGYFSRYQENIITEEQAARYYQSIQDLHKAIKQGILEYENKKAESDKIIEENNTRISNLPWIVRKIFKIKEI